MNEQAEALKICRHLDQGTEHLPYRVSERLAAARAAALARVAAEPAEAAGQAAAHPAPPSGRDKRTEKGGKSAPLWWRLAATAVPLALLAVGVVVVDTVRQEQSAAELAEVDSALLTDDVPLVAYADHGFGVYIKNTRR
jgi:hypothetical protein